MEGGADHTRPRTKYDRNVIASRTSSDESETELLLMRVNDDVTVRGVRESGWRRFNNAYALHRANKIILIDTGLQRHASLLHDVVSLAAASGSSYTGTLRDVETVLLTHWHDDHVGGCSALPTATKYLHAHDLVRLTSSPTDVLPLPVDRAVVSAVEPIEVGCHTPGSVAFHDRASRTLFIGDFLGDAWVDRSTGWTDVLPTIAEARVGVERLLDGRAGSVEGVSTFLAGLQRLRECDARFLCPGHGGVRRGDVERFLTVFITATERLLERTSHGAVVMRDAPE